MTRHQPEVGLRAGTTTALAFALLSGAAAAASEPRLLADLAPGEVTIDASGFVPQAVQLGPTPFEPGDDPPALIFVASTPATGSELWRAEWQPGGWSTPTLLRDLCPGPCDASPEELILGGTGVVFSALDGAGAVQRRLFTSDGTRAGTLRVGGPCPGETCFADPRYLTRPGRAGRLVYFFAADAAHGDELWQTDGTPAGTRRLGDLCPGSCSSAAGLLTPFGPFGESRILAGLRTIAGAPATLWVVRGDGTVARLSESCAGSDAVPSIGGAYFSCSEGAFEAGRELWFTDGTAAGTLEVPLDCPGCPELRPAPGAALGNGDVVFTSPTGAQLGLWATDPTGAGTRLLATLPVLGGSLFASGGRVYFQAQTPGLGTQLWSTDGTPLGTSAVTRLEPPTNGRFFFTGSGDDGRVFFTVTPTEAEEPGVYVTDGTTDGTLRLSELDAGYPTFVDGRAVFSVPFDGDDPAVLWATDGTAAGTVELLAGSGPASGRPHRIAALGDGLLFATGDVFEGGGALWQAGEAALVQLADFPGGGSDVAVRGAEALAGGFGGLVATDGTPLGTTVLADDVAAPFGFTRFQGHTYFAAAGPPDGGVQLWRTDGTPAGTGLFADLSALALGTAAKLGVPEPPSSDPADFTPLGERMLFAATAGVERRALWSTDGTPAGTAIVVDPCLVAGCAADPRSLTRVPGTAVAVFSADEAGDRELWRSDGTAAGTFRVADLLGGVSSSPHGLTAFRGRVYFFAALADGGEGLWRTDGTADGTELVTPLAIRGTTGEVVAATRGDRPQLASTEERLDATRVAVAGGLLYFVVDHPATGAELWASDGSAAGTGLVRDLDPGPSGGGPAGLVAAGTRLLFAAEEGTHGREPWASDGTESGTRRLADVAPGSASSSPEEIAPGPSLIGFRADDGTTGRELWAVDSADVETVLAAGGCRPAGRRLCLVDGRFAVEVRFRDAGTGAERTARAVPLTDETGAFWFFQAANLELLVKVIDGREVDGSFWVFAGGLTDVAHRITVTDTATGVVRDLHQAAGALRGLAALGLFPDPAVPGRRPPVVAPPAGPGCGGDPDALCLQGGRFAVKLTFVDQHHGDAPGVGQPIAGSDDTGFFWFFRPENVEVAVKVLDGRAENGRFWVFRGGLTDVGHTVEVRDLETGAVRTYHHAPGTLGGEADVLAF